MIRRESDLTVDRARELVARHWSDAQEATGTSNCDLARAWGCDEKVPRNIRGALAELTGSKIRRAPVRQAVEFLRRLLGELEASRPEHCLTPEGQAQVVLADAADVMGVTLRAMADGKLTPDEARAILAELRPHNRAARELEVQLEELARNGLRAVEGGR